MDLPPLRTKRWQSLAEYRWRFRRYWNGPRGVSTPPPYHALAQFLEGRWVATALLVNSPFFLVFPLLAQTPKSFSVCGLALDICGFLLVFREWLMQYRRWEAEEAERIAIMTREREPETPFDAEEIEEIGRPSIQRHMYDGFHERAREIETTALTGAALILIGFVFQTVGALLG